MEYGTEKSGGLKALEKAYHDAIEDVITINELKKWTNELNEKDVKFLIQELNRYYHLEMNLL